MVKAWPSKDPDEVLDYTYDWSNDLEVGETIASEDVALVVPAGVVLGSVGAGPQAVTVWLSGGTDGQEATVRIRITTSSVPPRTLEDTVVIPIAATIAPVFHPGDYSDPTPSNLVAAFPEFASVSVNIIRYYLDRAAGMVDTTWAENDFAYARMLLAAHYLTLRGLGDTTEAKAIANGSDQYRSISIGSLRLERFDQSAALVAGRFGVTSYGRQFRILLRANKGGPRVTGANLGGWGDGDRSQRGPWTY